MAQFKRRQHSSSWDAEVQRVQQRNALVQHLTDLNSPDARAILKKMRVVKYERQVIVPEGFETGSVDLSWNPKGESKRCMGSSAKCDRINSGIRAKGHIPR